MSSLRSLELRARGSSSRVAFVMLVLLSACSSTSTQKSSPAHDAASVDGNGISSDSGGTDAREGTDAGSSDPRKIIDAASIDAARFDGEYVSCAVFAPRMNVELERGTFIVAGTDANNYTYYVDVFDQVLRVFVSMGGSPFERVELGGDATTDRFPRYFFEIIIADDIGGFSLFYELDRESGQATLAKGPFDLSTFGTRIPDNAERLTIVNVPEDTALYDWPLRYVASRFSELATREWILVTRPRRADPIHENKLYFGTSEMLHEQTLLSATEAEDGTRALEFIATDGRFFRVTYDIDREGVVAEVNGQPVSAIDLSRTLLEETPIFCIP